MNFVNRTATSDPPRGESNACRLECIEKPQFSFGQLLTDQDLTSLVEWTRKKAQLARYRVGWGVVCGLDLGCDRTGDDSVILGPGYAIDCCGNDIVVCSQTRVSLEDSLEQEVSYEELARSKKEETKFGEIAVSDVIAVDLSLWYKEDNASPRATIGLGDIRGTARQYTRARESFAVVSSLGAAASDADDLEAEQWAKDYRHSLDVLQQYSAECGRAKGTDIHRWLKNWVTKHPAHQFRFFEDWISDRPPESWTEEEAVKVLFWIVQDRRNAFLQGVCHSCAEQTGVPIGRVWLQKVVCSGNRKAWRVLSVDQYPPVRRVLRGPSWPAAKGQVNAAQAMWLPLWDAAIVLTRIGFSVGSAPAELKLPKEVTALHDALGTKLQLQSGSKVNLQYFDAGALGFRTLGAR